MPRATSLAARIEKAAGVSPELIPGERGAFEVVIDSKLMYSKLETGRFPDEIELTDEIVHVFGCK
ncbi:Rdx family protein [Desulforhopalus vacuolatus]|uniref:Rdx family protein n=1 Tax=Desulforhopalus vacuolatus TaxID=40414 RepID=UPI0019667844|nr:Rdx family protein [Desulforhopalus vacuolatus]MBM9518623.1 Rdx family protein [Desulforhopalus vacuolatus]